MAIVPFDVATCPECGASMRSDKAIEGSDAVIYPELSRANLLRMRGQYREAIDLCLATLKRYPNNATLHTLLGDIYAEQDDLDQASQWYELALDLDPESATDQHKLAAIRERQRVKESANSIESLGIPAKRPNVPLFAILSIGTVLLVGVIAYMIGQGAQPHRQAQILAPVSAPSTSPGSTDTQLESSTSPVVQREAQVDRELVSLVRQRSPSSGNLGSILTDPRSHIAIVTYYVGANEDERRVGAELARTLLEQNGDTLIVTLRAIRDDRVGYMADVPRSRYNDLLSGTVPMTGDAWISHILTNEWPTQETTQPQVETPTNPSTNGGSVPDQTSPSTTAGGPSFTPLLGH